MSTMLIPHLVPDYLRAKVEKCPSCEADRRPRMFVCTYHEGFWDGYEAGYRQSVVDNG